MLDTITMQKVWDLRILDVADRLHINYAPRGSFRKCHCFMHDDKTPSMWFKLSNNTWSCPVCQKGGGIVSLVEAHENLKFKEAVEWLIREFNIYCYDDNEPYRPLKSGRKTESQKMQNSEFKIQNGHQPSTLDRQPLTFINPDYLKVCFSAESLFCKSLVSNNILTESQMQEAAERYHLGITRDGGVIFWQIDEQQRVRDGKIMFYKSDCHRDHQHDPSSVSSRLIKQGKLPADWTANHCLFGLHLLHGDGDSDGNDRIIAIVESEKTAIICSELLPAHPLGEAGKGVSITWLATGGKSNLTVENLRPLNGRIIIFPDTDPTGITYHEWLKTAQDASKKFGHPLTVSNILELHATEDQKRRKIDIADFIIERR